MSKIIICFKLIFHISTLVIIILSLYPGSLLGLIFYGNSSQQPNIVENPFGTSINHFISYFYLSMLGLLLYLKDKNFEKIFYRLIFLSIILEVLQFVVPNRAFQLTDLFANIFGVLVAYFLVKIYLIFIKL